ncbi:methylesterase 10-like [Humulus lupulus]|uniref:methylesterase 10-like n=1 Tax=Humulus lupulus TaxID=3486 RepID=UPI002B415530|nr:methylesterase 10-like [Humulus lupulus]
MDQQEEMRATHFVLVHGACHGAWCWYKLMSLLKVETGNSNHHVQVTALDLGASGINPKLLDEVPTVDDYVQPLMEFMASLPEDHRVILVGHSYAGLCISLAMEKFPHKISLAVFLTAYMPNFKSPPALLIQEYFKGTTSILDSQIKFEEDRPLSVIFGPQYMKTKMYPHSQPQELELAKMLVRPSGLYMEDFEKKNVLSEAKFGSVKRVFIVCEEDEVMKEEFQRWMIEISDPPLTEEEVIVVKGADHMVMLSQPHQLSKILTKLSYSYTTI